MFKFTKAQEKQIAGRFDAMYKVLTAKKWVQNVEALDKDGEEVEPTDKAAVSFCLIGAVRHINGPTEEEIACLIALQIIIQEDRLDDNVFNKLGIEDYGDLSTGAQMNAIMEYIHFLMDCSGDRESIIIEWNDENDRTATQVRAMLKKAQKLYGKVWDAYKINVQRSKIVNALEAFDSKVKSPF